MGSMKKMPHFRGAITSCCRHREGSCNTRMNASVATARQATASAIDGLISRYGICPLMPETRLSMIFTIANRITHDSAANRTIGCIRCSRCSGRGRPIRPLHRTTDGSPKRQSNIDGNSARSHIEQFQLARVWPRICARSRTAS